MAALDTVLAQGASVLQATTALGLSRATYYRHRFGPLEGPAPAPPPPPDRKLEPEVRQQVLDHLRSERFMDKSPYTVFAELLDDDHVYLCSIRTKYRILNEEKEVRERRDVTRHPSYAAPSLVATQPNEVWTWDITKLRGPTSWTYYYLYVVLDLFSRYVVGWMVADSEKSALADKLISTCYQRQGVKANELTLHADRGTSMTSKQVAHLLSDLGVTQSHSRPRVSDDNAFSEAQFKTLKYRPDFPDNFNSLLDSQGFLEDFFRWYNWEHRHSSLGLMTPGTVHHGGVQEVLEARVRVMEAVYAAHPERFVNGPPVIQAPSARVVLGLDPTRTSETTGGGAQQEAIAPRTSETVLP